ncbi:MAG: ATP-binding protein [Verrucomicrobiota bacterium]
MIQRDIQEELQESAGEYPVVTVTGPRQAGKTTLARMTFPRHLYVSFEQPLAREQFRDDPVGFLHRHAGGAVFDEVQNVPELLSYLQQEVDEDPRPGRFILTGSQHFALSEKISQSLAGRTAVLELLPFSISELRRGRFLDAQLDRVLWRGAYPPVHDRHLRPQRWYGGYMATYIDRDVRQLTTVQDLDTFHRFMRLAAGNVGQLFNSSRLAADCGIDHKTARRWLNILQASYVAHLLPPYHENFRKRVVKTPKLYFYDTGLVCHLLGINEPDQLETHPLRGAVFENWVFTELSKTVANHGLPHRFSFWRTHGGQEVDFIVEGNGVIMGIEVKAGMTARPGDAQPLLNALQNWREPNKQATVLFGGEEEYYSRNCRFVPWRQINALINPNNQMSGLDEPRA